MCMLMNSDAAFASAPPSPCRRDAGSLHRPKSAPKAACPMTSIGCQAQRQLGEGDLLAFREVRSRAFDARLHGRNQPGEVRWLVDGDDDISHRRPPRIIPADTSTLMHTRFFLYFSWFCYQLKLGFELQFVNQTKCSWRRCRYLVEKRPFRWIGELTIAEGELLNS
jgi:hypothetical protein